MDKYSAPIFRLRHEIEIKRSRFISTVDFCESREQAQQIINSIREEMPTANHHCWAMVAGDPDNDFLVDQSDDGEPHGTAGKPMLNVLRHSGIGNVVVVVTRYFGGTKLGTGGLARAYSQSVSESIKLLKLRKIEITESYFIEFPYDIQSRLDNFLKNKMILIDAQDYSELVQYQIKVPVSMTPSLEKTLTDLCHGNIQISSINSN